MFLEEEIWSGRGKIKPSEHQGTINLVYSLVKLQPESCDVLSDGVGKAQLLWISQGSLWMAGVITAVLRALVMVPEPTTGSQEQ